MRIPSPRTWKTRETPESPTAAHESKRLFSRGACPARSRHYANLPEHLALLHPLLCFAQLFQGKDRVHHRKEYALLDKSQALQKSVPAPHISAQNAMLLAEEKTQIDFHLAAGGRPAGDQSSVASQTPSCLLPHGRADVLDHDVRAQSARLAANFLGYFLLVVIEQDVSAELLRAAEFFFGSRDGEDAGAGLLGVLDRGPAHPSRRPANDHFVIRLHPSPLVQHVPGRDKGKRHGRPFGECTRLAD